jgi:hypothetical protein
MSSMDLYEDGFPHGTKEGYERGCKSAACPNAFEGETICRDAFMRYNRDYAYRKAVDAGETPPPEFPAPAPTSGGPAAEVRVFPEPTVTAVDSVEPLPEPEPEVARKRAPKTVPVHPSPAMYQRGCRKDNDCPSFLAGGISCRRARLDYVKARGEIVRAEREAAGSQFDRVDVAVTAPAEDEPRPESAVEQLLTAITSDSSVECTVTVLPSGALVVVIRIPAQVVAA